MRGLKIAGWVVGGVFALVAGALVLAWALFDPNDHKDRLQAAFHDATGRELRLDGRLSLSFVPWLAIETGPASVSNRAGFGEQPFAALEHARLGVRLWPLLASRRVEFGNVRVGGLRLHLAVARDGTDNWSDLLERLQADEAESTPVDAAETVELSMAGFELADARLEYDDAQAGTAYALQDWDLRAGALRRGATFDVETSLDALRDARPLGRFELHTTVDPTQAGQLALRSTTGRVALPREGRDPLVVDLQAPTITRASASRDITVEQLGVRLGPARVLTSLAIAQGRSGATTRGDFVLDETNPRDLLAALGIAAPVTRDAKALAKLGGSGKLRYAADTGLQVDGLDLALDDTRLQGRLGIADLERMALRFDLSGTTLDLDRYLPPEAPAPPPAPAPKGVPPKEPRPALDVAGTLRFAGLTVVAVPLTQVSAEVRVHDGKLAFAPLQATAFGGRATTNLDYDFAAVTPTLRLEQRLVGVDVAAMLGALFDVRQLTGRGNATFDLTTRGADGAALFANLAGPFDVTVTDGTVLGVDVWYEIERAMAVAQTRAPTADVVNHGRTEFSRFATRGTLRGRALQNERMELLTDFARVEGRGRVDYGDNRLDLDLTARLLKTPSGRLFGMKVSRLQDAPIPLDVGGTLQEPKVRPDVSKLLQAVAKDTLKQPLEEKVKKELEKLLKF
jgi:AsmA protein